MTDRDDLAELINSARNVIKSATFYFNGRIRYETKGEKREERLLCMDAMRIYICSLKIPVKVESQFHILTIKLIDHVADSHVIIEAEEKQVHSFYGLQEKSSLQPFLVVLIRNLHAVFPHRLTSIVDIRPENEYEKLLRLSNESFEEPTDLSNSIRPCSGYSLRYESACDLYQQMCYRPVQNLVDTVFAHRLSREFTFREFESVAQKDWIPILIALRHNEWFKKLTIENTKLSSEVIEELCVVTRLCKTIEDLRLNNCSLRPDFCTKFAHSFQVTHIEHLDLSNNPIEDKGLNTLTSSLAQRKLPLRSVSLQYCSLTHKSLYGFHTALTTNSFLLKSLQILNLTGNRIKEENCLTLLFSNPDNVLDELHLSDIEFPLESFFHSLATLSCKLRRLFISSSKASSPSSITGGAKLFFSKIASLEILQLANGNLSTEFLRELCDGLQANTRLTKLDLRLNGNPLETFIRDYAPRFASIPCLVALDISGCDADNELVTLLIELKKNRHLKSLHLGRNLNNIKTKNLSRTINALKELIGENSLEFLSIADSKLKENTGEIILALTNNNSIQTLDIRGNGMGDPGVRALCRVLRTNRHLKMIYFDRNLLSLINLEDIVESMEENYVIQYLPMPITDIILMKTTEKERMEKLQQILTRLDTICTRNQQRKETIYSNDSLLLIPTANLSREMTIAWENQQQLLGDQASFDYISSCASRSPSKIDEANSILTRTERIGLIGPQLKEIYLEEEEHFQNRWKELMKKFQELSIERNERLARKFYQVFKDQTQLTYDDKFQEQIRNYFTRSNESIEQLLNEETPARLNDYSRECFINVTSSLQKRALDVNNEMGSDMHKQLESLMFQSTSDSQGQSSASTLDRLVSRGTHVINRIAHKNSHAHTETTDDSSRTLKKADSAEYLEERSPKPTRSNIGKESRLLPPTQSKGPAPTSPKPSGAGWRKSVLVSSNDQDSNVPPNSESVYTNVHIPSSARKNETSADDEGDLIEHDLLDLVEQERRKDQQNQQRAPPPAIPPKKRPVAAPTQEDSLNIEVEPTTKLVHPVKDRPRRANISRPARRPTNGASNDSSSDGGLDNDEPSSADVPISATPSTTENPLINSSPIVETQPVPDASSKKVSQAVKGVLRPYKTSDESPPPMPLKQQPSLPSLQSRPSNLPTAPKPVLPSHEPPQLTTPENSHEPIQPKPPMKEETDTVGALVPPVVARTGRAAIGTRVFPVLDPSGEPPAVRLRHFQSTDKKDTNPPIPEGTATVSETSMDTDEQYKRMSVKERARMLTSNIPANEKKIPPS